MKKRKISLNLSQPNQHPLLENESERSAKKRGYQLNITFNFDLTPYIEGDDAAAC